MILFYKHNQSVLPYASTIELQLPGAKGTGKF